MEKPNYDISDAEVILNYGKPDQEKIKCKKTIAEPIPVKLKNLSELFVKVNVQAPKQNRIRLSIGVWLLKLGARVIGCPVKIDING
jgi:hypothetical protein